MSAAAEVRTHLMAALKACERLVSERVAAEDEIRDLVLKVNELTIKLRDQNQSE